MKRLLCYLSCLLCFFPVFSASVFSGTEISVSADAAAVQDLVMRRTSIQISADVRLSLEGDFQLRIPVRLSYKKSALCFESGLNVVYYPFSKGLFFSLSMADLAYVYNTALKAGKLYAVNEIEAGWTIDITKKFFLEPSVAVRDPSGTFAAEYEELKGAFSSYSRIRIRLCGGYRFKTED